MGKADKLAVQAITGFEAAVPSAQGVIPKTLGNLVLFVAYMGLVAYVLLRVARLALRIVFGIAGFFLCGVCCCRLCRGRKAAAVAAPKAKGKAANGSVPTATKANGKKNH